MIKELQMHVSELIEAHVLSPAPYNPNKLSNSKYEALKESIRKDGFIDPIVVQKRGMNIIGGHHRLRAIKEICVEDCVPIPEVPCVVLNVDDETAKKLNLKLNHIKGEPDARLLGELLVDIYPSEVRVEPDFESHVNMLGFELDEASKYIRVIEPDAISVSSGSERIDGFGKSITLSLEFTDTRVRDHVKKVLQQRVEVEKKKSGDVVAAILAPAKKVSKKKPVLDVDA